MKNWERGLPSEFVSITANDAGTMKYWFDGLPSKFIGTGGTPPVTVNSNFFMFFG